MATASQINNFINEIAPYAQEAYAKLGKVLPSVCIGMACIESAYGTSSIMRNHNAYFGQKVGSGKTATKYWNGKFFTSKTKEEYTVGNHTVITSAFRAYDSMKQSVFNYYELLNTNLYKKVTAGTSYQTQMQQIKACGYMTSSTEVNSVINIIQKYNLQRFDEATISVPSSDVDDILTPTLRRGDRNEYVRSWQTFLNINGYSCGEPDGIYGQRTQDAVVKYQQDHGMESGIIGPQTWATLPMMQ